MELDEFKTMIARRRPAVPSASRQADFEAVIRKNKRSLVRSIRQSLVLEIFFALSFIAFTCFIIARYRNTHIQVFGWGMLVLCVVFTAYLLLLQKKIRHYDTTLLSVRESLESLIQIVAGFSRLYFQLTMIMLPLAFLFSLFVVFLEAHLSFTLFISQFSTTKIILYLSAVFTWCLLMYFFTKWYIRKLYGDFLQQLKNQLKELLNG